MRITSFVLATVICFCACSTPQTTTTTTKTTESENAAVSGDKIEYYETDFEVRQKDYLDKLIGNWTVTTMQRQARLPEEQLSNISLQLNANRTFSAKLACGDVNGSYTLKGTSIKFNGLSNTTCSGNEQMTELMRLLSSTVSAYTVEDKSLLLRDGSSNVVFKAEKAY